MKKNIQKIAENLFREQNNSCIPVQVEEIAKKIGISISYAPSEEYSGMLLRKEEEKKILMGINSSESYERKRFTIAHELGHYFLHKNVVMVDYRMSYSAPKPLKEKEADEFAGNLLMPASYVINDFNVIISGGVFFESDLNFLAKKYEVSSDAMKIRLIKLGLIQG